METKEFIERWLGSSGGRERSNLPTFISGLCKMLDVDAPLDPASKGVLGRYEYEGPVPNASVRAEKVSANTGFIDLYKEGCFILEAKQSYLKAGQSEPDTKEGSRYDLHMRGAYQQARNYAVNIPADRPGVPFLIVCDIGRAFEIYFDWAGNGRGYEPFPDAQSYRITLDQLANADIQKRFRGIWTAPESVDPRKISADVTRRVAVNLAMVSETLEGTLRRNTSLTPAERATQIQEASLFLMRILFCMFAEDVELLPKDSFKQFLERTLDKDELFARQLENLWQNMGQANKTDRFADAVEAQVPYFNGGLFRNPAVFPLIKSDRELLHNAAGAQWKNVEPAIFGTMLEKALGKDRAKLGAHYTPRKYVEFLVRATFIDDLEVEWTAVEDVAREGKADEALSQASTFHDKLASLKILDPACGTGNFLYVSMELMLKIEARLIVLVRDLGGQASQRIDPRQFFGLELNTGAAKITELVLWIGWLRQRMADPQNAIPDPVLATLETINLGSLDSFDSVVRHHIETVPETGLSYLGEPDSDNPGPPDWPEADYIVGNPPFTGGGSIRKEQGDDYAELLWAANPDVAPSADLVMHWWNRAAAILQMPGTRLKRFGFVTTSSITQEFSRRVIAQHLNAISIIMAVPNHPWVKLSREEKIKGVKRAAEADLKMAKMAAVRIAMTVAEAGAGKEGRLFEVESESALDTDNPEICFFNNEGTVGIINADLSVGADVTRAIALKANAEISVRGVELHAKGYVIDAITENVWRRENPEFYSAYVKPYISSNDLLSTYGDRYIADFSDLSEKDVRMQAPRFYDHLLTTAKEGRKTNSVKSRRELWWRLALPHVDLRDLLDNSDCYIATVVTAKYRWFTMVSAKYVPDQSIMAIGLSDHYSLGILSSRIHVVWSVRVGGKLGAGNDPRYNNTKIFDPFPFPIVTSKQSTDIADIAEELEHHRKEALSKTPSLSMTEIYNLRAAINAGHEVDRERATKARARAIDELHRKLDTAVADAYGWPADLAPAEIVARLIALNAERAKEEAEGNIRWLRPDYQIPRFGSKK
jgi:hypothetical protein